MFQRCSGHEDVYAQTVVFYFRWTYKIHHFSYEHWRTGLRVHLCIQSEQADVRWNQGFQQWDGPVHMAWKSSYDSILLPVSSSLLLHVEGWKKSIESDWKGMLQPEKKYARVSNFWNGLYIFQHMTPPHVSLFWFIIETNKYTTLSYHDCLTGCKSGLPMGVSGQFCPLCRSAGGTGWKPKICVIQVLRVLGCEWIQ